MHKGSFDAFNTMLTLKILWSSAAIIAIVLGLVEGGASSLWLFFGIFVSFSVVWIYYKLQLTRGRDGVSGFRTPQ
ncbi:MAG: hypothetical protein JRF33_10245 [Deltaproteobacteria bacterium]|nr:hypothetical protein [Deltaproteobacteria bacterium]